MIAEPRRYFVGVDLGQRQDYTAVAVVERSVEVLERDYVTWGWKTAVWYDVRHLERIALGTAYTQVAERVRELARELARPSWMNFDPRCALVVDATGVGAPVVELIRKPGLNCEVTAVTITGGDRETRDGGVVRVPKRDLVVGLQVLLEGGGVRIAEGLKDGPVLLKELAEMRVEVSEGGREQYGAWRQGSHDDLVLALALACWRARKG